MSRKRRSRFEPQSGQGEVQDEDRVKEEEEEEEGEKGEEEEKCLRRIPSPEPVKTEEERMQEMVSRLFLFKIFFHLLQVILGSPFLYIATILFCTCSPIASTFCAYPCCPST